MRAQPSCPPFLLPVNQPGLTFPAPAVSLALLTAPHPRKPVGHRRTSVSTSHPSKAPSALWSRGTALGSLPLPTQPERTGSGSGLLLQNQELPSSASSAARPASSFLRLQEAA